MPQTDRLLTTSSNFLHVLGGELLLRLANVVVAVMIGRLYGAAKLGIYAAILAVATLADRFADNGLEMYGISEASRTPEDLDRLGTALYINKTILSLAAIGLLGVIALRASFAHGYLLIGSILTLRTFLYSYCRLNGGLLKALGKAAQISRIQAVHFAVLCFAIFISYSQKKGIAFLLACLLAAQIVELLLSFWVLRRFGFRFKKVSRELCWKLARSSSLIGLTYTLSTLMLRADVLILSLLVTASAVGAFAAADTGLVMVYVAAWLFSGVLLADLGALSPNLTGFNAYFRKCVSAILIICIPLAVAAMLLAPSAIVLFYGSNFSAAKIPAALMSATIPFIVLNAAFLSRAVAHNAASTCLAVYGAGAALSLALNFLLGWRYGGAGIAVSILIREMAITFAFLWLISLPWKAASSTAPVNPGSELLQILDTGKSLEQSS